MVSSSSRICSTSSWIAPRTRTPFMPAGRSPCSPSCVAVAVRGAVDRDDIGQEVETAVLQHQGAEITCVEELDPQLRVELAQVPQLAVLLSDQRLLQRRQLDVEVDLGQVE